MTESFWQTPGGQRAHMAFREDTSDWNTISACLRNPTADTGDEYHLPSGLSGWALDIGAHIGAVTVGLLLDNPDLRVVAIEAVPENVTLLRRNLELNDLTDRCVVLAGAAWSAGSKVKRIEYGYTGSEIARVHAYIGSVSPWISTADREYTDVPVITLAGAIAATGGAGFVWVKSDCEGCEHRFLKGPGMAKVGFITGEWHRRDGTPESFRAQLDKTHMVTWQDGDGQGGPFEAVPR